jgi:hypothetical protein
MPEATAARASSSRCQARPRAARPGYREDMLCASSACTTIEYRGVAMPVCRIHEAKYQRWGAQAEENAESQWGWAPAATHQEPTAGEPRTLASAGA